MAIIDELVEGRRVDLVLVVVGVVAMVALTHWGPGLANDTSRLASAEALVEHGRFAIDGTHFEYTVDKIKVDGRFYSDKPPLLSLYLAGLYGVLYHAFGWTIEGNLPLVYYLLTLLSSGVAFVATLVGVRRLASEFGASARWAGAVAMAAGFGTLMWPYSVVVSSHAAAAPCLVWFGLLLVEEVDASGLDGESTDPSVVRAVGAGALGATAAVIEPLAAVFVIPMAAGYAARIRSWWAVGGLALGGLLPAIPHVVITYQISGHPLLANLDPAHFEWKGSIHTEENLSGVGWAHQSYGAFFTYAYHCLVGYRGGVMYNMSAALGAGCAVWGFSRGRSRWFVGAALVGGLAFLALTLGWTSNYSGWAYGIRWHATPAPLFVSFIGLVLSGEGRAYKIGAVGLGVTFVFGTLAAAPGTLDPWTPSTHEEYSIVEVVSGEAVYLDEHLDASLRHLRRGRPFEARYQAEHIVRRSPSFPAGWEVAIRASMRLDDRERLRDYRRRLRSGAGPDNREVRRRLLEMIRRGLASDREDTARQSSVLQGRKPAARSAARRASCGRPVRRSAPESCDQVLAYDFRTNLDQECRGARPGTSSVNFR